MTAVVIDFPRKAQPQAVPPPLDEASRRVADTLLAWGYGPAAYLDPTGRSPTAAVPQSLNPEEK